MLGSHLHTLPILCKHPNIPSNISSVRTNLPCEAVYTVYKWVWTENKHATGTGATADQVQALCRGMAQLHPLPALELTPALMQQSRSVWLHSKPEQEINWLKANAVKTNKHKGLRGSLSPQLVHCKASEMWTPGWGMRKKEAVRTDARFTNCRMIHHSWCCLNGCRQQRLQTTSKTWELYKSLFTHLLVFSFQYYTCWLWSILVENNSKEVN